MTRNMRDWIDDERAVSPVIGVILMVAITVILAAVIGTFVLDLGQSAGQSAPQASLSVTVDTSVDEVTIEHTGGDAIDQANTRVIFEKGDGTSSTWSTAPNSRTLSVGESTTFDIAANDTADTTGPLSGMGWDNNAVSFDPGDSITVTLIDTESQRQIFETTVTA